MARTIIKLSPRIDIAVRALTVIDSYNGVRISFDEIVKFCSLRNPSTSRGVFMALVKAGILDSNKSRLGGYKRVRKTNLLELTEILQRKDELRFMNPVPEEKDVFNNVLWVQQKLASITI